MMINDGGKRVHVDFFPTQNPPMTGFWDDRRKCPVKFDGVIYLQTLIQSITTGISCILL